MGRELESVEKFLGIRKLEKGLCYKSPKKEITFCAVKQLIYNLKIYNGIKL